MFDFIDDLSVVSKGLFVGTLALGAATLVSRHFDKKAVQQLIAAADEECDNGQQVVDPTCPMQATAGQAAPQI